MAKRAVGMTTSHNRARLRCHSGVLDPESPHPQERITAAMYQMYTVCLALGKFFTASEQSCRGFPGGSVVKNLAVSHRFNS